MQTPTRARRNRSSTDLTGTDLSSIFDVNSPWPNPISPVSDGGRKFGETEEAMSQERQEPAVNSNVQHVPSIVFEPKLYGTAASQREKRMYNTSSSSAGVPSYTSSFSQSELIDTTSATIRNELTPAPTEKDEAPSASPSKPSKLKQAATKKTRSIPAKCATQTITKPKRKKLLTQPGDEQHSATSEPHLGKRKLDSMVPGPIYRALFKKAKKKRTTVSPDREYVPQEPLASVEDDSPPRRRVTRRMTNAWRSASSQGTVLSEVPVPENAGVAAAPPTRSIIVKLKISGLVDASSIRAQPSKPFAKTGDESARVGDASLRSSPPLAENSVSHKSSSCPPPVNAPNPRTQAISFSSMIDVSSSYNPEQCAQTTPAPVAVSSQGESSFDSCQVVQSMELQYDFGLATSELQVMSPEHDLNNSTKFGFENSPSLFRHAAAQPVQLVPFNSTETGLNMPPLPRYDESTQPTVPWYPTHALTVPDANDNSDADSETTMDEVEESDFLVVGTDLWDEQQHLHEIATTLFANRHSVKLAPAGQPEVWADGRQEMCETLHYFRSYQSACYCTGGFVRGFMFDNNGHARDYIDSDVVISRAGGGMVKDKDSGEMKAGRDQSDDTPTEKSLRNCMKQYNPVVVIVGLNNPHVPSKPPHQYCVLDYFKPTYIWAEKSGKTRILRYRFEKLNTKKDSWWRPAIDKEAYELGSLGLAVEKTCDCCNKPSLQIYLNGWMCLLPKCTAFWHIVDDSSPTSYEPDEASLIYDPRFLKQKTFWPNDDTEYPLTSSVAELSRYAVSGEDCSQAFWAGMVCPDCGRCNSRVGWTGWNCSNPKCSYKQEPPHTLIPAASLHDHLWPLTAGYTLSRDISAPLIDVNVSFAHGYRINRYTIPGLDGFITHMIANKTVLEEPGGPNAMFEELQQIDIGLQRRSMPNGQLKGENYCRHFAVNYGMPYKFIAATSSRSFDRAARPITATRSRLNWAAQHLLSQEPNASSASVSAAWKAKEFNEVLALGYFESQKMNFHDDGETGLGPTIATLSLGAPGTMRIRMKARHYNGASTSGIYDDSRPLPGCAHFEARDALHASLRELKTADRQAHAVRLKQIPRQLKLKTSGNAKEVLRMELGHGDVVVMHGAELQKYYEHAVEHAGKLRFALTCRYIDPGSLKEGDRPGYVVGSDERGYDGSKLC